MLDQAYASARFNGLRDAECRLAAHEVLGGIVRGALSDGTARDIVVVLDPDWQCRWPRPYAVFPSLHTRLKLVLLPGGQITFEEHSRPELVHGYFAPGLQAATIQLSS